MARFLWVGWLCLGLSARVHALEPPAPSTAAFQTVCDDLRAVTRVKAEFVEEKTLHILSHPIQSTGTILFSPQEGVYRIMQQPVHQELLITRSRLVQKDAQGTVQHMSVRGQPAAQAFVDVFLSFFTGDRHGWEKTFDAAFSGSVSDWKIELIPRRKSPAAKTLRKILLEGREGVLDAMTLTETNGDETHTVYTHQQVSHDETSRASFHFPTDLTSP
jgi:hypothetical protein